MLPGELLVELKISADEVGVLLIDHGSRRDESNELLTEAARLFQKSSGYAIVEPAHMELAEPSISQAFAAAVRKGARLVIAFPYFLSPGRHWSQDIPRLVGQAAASHPQIRYLVTAPFGVDELMMRIIESRIDCCLSHVVSEKPACEICQGDGSCQLKEGEG